MDGRQLGRRRPPRSPGGVLGQRRRQDLAAEAPAGGGGSRSQGAEVGVETGLPGVDGVGEVASRSVSVVGGGAGLGPPVVVGVGGVALALLGPLDLGPCLGCRRCGAAEVAQLAEAPVGGGVQGGPGGVRIGPQVVGVAGVLVAHAGRVRRGTGSVHRRIRTRSGHRGVGCRRPPVLGCTLGSVLVVLGPLAGTPGLVLGLLGPALDLAQGMDLGQVETLQLALDPLGDGVELGPPGLDAAQGLLGGVTLLALPPLDLGHLVELGVGRPHGVGS